VPHRESIKRALQKDVKPSKPLKTMISIQATDMASTAYVGLRAQHSKKIYGLEELVGQGSKFGFQLVPWDGVYVSSSTSPAPNSQGSFELGPPSQSWTSSNGSLLF
jgi:hypothetical protein